MPNLKFFTQVQCSNCLEVFWKRNCRINETKKRGDTKHFCNRECMGQYRHRAHRGNKRSRRPYTKKLPPLIAVDVFKNEKNQ